MIIATTKSLLFNPLKAPPFLPLKCCPKVASISARLDDSQQRLNLSVLRFTLGIPGLDESYLPRWIGYGFGSLLILNHLLGSDSVAAAQLRSEALGISLAAFSVTLPYFGKFLKGASPVDQTTLPEGAEQIFLMSQNMSVAQQEDLAWATYVFLRKTNTTSALILTRGELCIRGYWNVPDGLSKDDVFDWFRSNIEETGLSDLMDTLYFPETGDAKFWKMLPQGTRSVLVQPVLLDPNPSTNEMGDIEGFVLLASSMRYAYSEKDRAWIRAVSNKLRNTSHISINAAGEGIRLIKNRRYQYFSTGFTKDVSYTPRNLKNTGVLQKFLEAIHQMLPKEYRQNQSDLSLRGFWQSGLLLLTEDPVINVNFNILNRSSTSGRKLKWQSAEKENESYGQSWCN